MYLMATRSVRTFAPDELEEWGRAVLDAVAEEAVRRSNDEDPEANPVTFDVEFEVRFLADPAEPSSESVAGIINRPRPCCICWRTPDGRRLCIGGCCE
jgi:hypothetical protein